MTGDLNGLFPLLMVFCIVRTGSSLSCFSCDHQESRDGMCDESFIECDASSASLGMVRVAALKPTVQIIPTQSFRCFELIVEDNADRYQTRGCSFDSVDVCQGEPRIGVQTGCRWCNDRDGCNSARSLRASLVVLGGLLLAGLTKLLLFH